MKYKLLLLDIDNTLTPNLGLPPCTYTPSRNVLISFKKALEKITISFCTGRDINTVKMICSKLNIKSPQIVEGGSKIIDIHGNILFVKYISKFSVKEIFTTLKNINTTFSVLVDGKELVNILPKSNLDKVTAILLYDLSPMQVDKVNQQLFLCKDIAFTLNPDRTGNTIYITNKLGLKSHGVKKLREILNIKKREIIGVGDSNNDKSLLLESGLKIAMGNSVPEIKAIANYIAPDVNHHGVVNVIEKYVLSSNSFGKSVKSKR